MAKKIVDKTPAPADKAKKTSAKKTAAPVKTKKEETTVEVTPPKVEEVAPVADENTAGQELSLAFTEFMAQLTSLRTLQAKLLTDFRGLQKRVDREIKAANKLSNKRKRKTGNRAPSGFVKPTLISDQLADFLGKPHGSELARTEVTREINAYIRANDLQDKSNGRIIKPDSKLKKLLGVKNDQELTYFNLQKFMSPHFQKAADSVSK
tara:strand:+ start:109 stop:732 length:624 start_codon:yes stop_codon:yes gene_type:complete